MHLGTRVDRQLGRHAGAPGPADQLGQLGDGERTGVVPGGQQEVRVAVRRAGDLPQAEVLTVGVARGQVRERAEDVGLALHDHDRHARVVANAVAPCEPSSPRLQVGRVGRVDAAQFPSFERRRGTGPALQQERVEDTSHWVDRVVVRREMHRRLRCASRDHAIDADAVLPRQQLAHRATELREHVERVRITRVLQRAVAVGCAGEQAHARHHAAADEADPLRGDTDPREPLTNEVAVRRHPQRGDVETAGDVQPLDDHRAVRARRLGGPVDHESGRVRGPLARLDIPAAVGFERTRGFVARRGAARDVLVRRVADGCEIEVHRHERRDTVERGSDRCRYRFHGRETTGARGATSVLGRSRRAAGGGCARSGLRRVNAR